MKNVSNEQKEREKLIKLADNAFRDYIIARDGYRCVICNKGKAWSLQSSHLFSRTSYILRWNEYNSFCMCSGCNARHEHNPHIYVIFFIDKYGLGQYRHLFEKSQGKHTYTNQDLIDIANDFKRKKEQLWTPTSSIVLPQS